MAVYKGLLNLKKYINKQAREKDAWNDLFLYTHVATRLRMGIFILSHRENA